MPSFEIIAKLSPNLLYLNLKTSMGSIRSTVPDWGTDSFLINAREPIYLLAADRRIIAVNHAWEELTGYLEAEVVGLECLPHGPTRAGDLAGLGGSFQPPPEAMVGQPIAGQSWIIRRGGERIQRRIEFLPFHDVAGQLTGLMAVVRPLEARTLTADSEHYSLRLALLELRAGMFARHAHDTLIGFGPEHDRILAGVDIAASSQVPVTLIGEPGTGKRFVARLIHQLGPRRQMPILGYDCQAIPPELLDREIFGGSTALSPTFNPGPIIAPEGSTLVIGDILATARDFQLRLALSLKIPAQHCRLIATTVGQPELAFDAGQLEPNLFYALTAMVIRLRPLRDRPEELPLLAQSMLERANLKGRTIRSGFSSGAIEAMLAYHWPGNLRELSRVVNEAHQAARSETIEARDLPAAILGERAGSYLLQGERKLRRPLKAQVLDYERQLIQQALSRFGQNKTKAARHLGVNRPYLYRRMKDLEIFDPEDNPDSPDPAASDETSGHPPSDVGESGGPA